MGVCGWVRVVKVKAKLPSILNKKKAPRKEKDLIQSGKEWKGIRCLTYSLTLTSHIFLMTRPPETHYS